MPPSSHNAVQLRLRCPSTSKLIQSSVMIATIVVGLIANASHILGDTQPFDMAHRHFTSLTPSPYVFGLWFFVYTRLLMLVVFELSNPASILHDNALISHCTSCIAHVVWLVAWARQWPDLYTTAVIVQTTAAAITLLVAHTHNGYGAVPGAARPGGREFFIEFMVGEFALNAWCAWSVFVAILSLATATHSTALPSSMESTGEVAVLGALFIGALVVPAVCVARGRFSQISAVCIYAWIVVGWFVRGFDSVAPVAHTIAIIAMLVVAAPILVVVYDVTKGWRG